MLSMGAMPMLSPGMGGAGGLAPPGMAMGMGGMGMGMGMGMASATPLPASVSSGAEVCFRLLCPGARTGSVIGRNGDVIKQLRAGTGARVKVGRCRLTSA